MGFKLIYEIRSNFKELHECLYFALTHTVLSSRNNLRAKAGSSFERVVTAYSLCRQQESNFRFSTSREKSITLSGHVTFAIIKKNVDPLDHSETALFFKRKGETKAETIWKVFTLSGFCQKIKQAQRADCYFLFIRLFS